MHKLKIVCRWKFFIPPVQENNGPSLISNNKLDVYIQVNVQSDLLAFLWVIMGHCLWQLILWIGKIKKVEDLRIKYFRRTRLVPGPQWNCHSTRLVPGPQWNCHSTWLVPGPQWNCHSSENQITCRYWRAANGSRDAISWNLNKK